MSTHRYVLQFSVILLAAFLATLLTCPAPAWAGGGRHGGHHGYGDHWSVGVGLNFGYPGPYPGGYYAPPYRYYPAYPYAYGPAYGGRIGIGYSSGYHDAFGLSFSLPLYFGPRPAPPPQPVLVPASQVAARQVLSDCQPTREYQTEIVIDGEAVPAWGTACLQADGSWRVLSGPFAEE
jgi:hypothetical protein